MRGPIKRLNSITKETETRILRVMKIVIAVIFVVGLVAVIVAGVIVGGN